MSSDGCAAAPACVSQYFWIVFCGKFKWLTVFSIWLNDQVMAAVAVDKALGGGRNVVARVYVLVGYKGVFVFFVILD